MTYELAKDLKDAGFVWNTHTLSNGECGICGKYMNLTDTASICESYYPTLSELIEACGPAYFCLSRRDHIWKAEHPHKELRLLVESSGLTPEEAVARLWLALNKK